MLGALDTSNVSVSLWVVGLQEAKFMPGGGSRTQLEIRMSSWTQSTDEILWLSPLGEAAELHVKGRGCVWKDVRQQWEVV